MTLNEAEELLAVHLLELGLAYERGFRYAPGRKFEADFVVRPENNAPFLVEIQGGVYSRQAHGSVTGILKDNERLYWAFRWGWQMIRFTPDQVKDGTAKRMIEEAL